ncbi:MAG: alpha-glucan family phosphorylase, partial [Acidobacteriota bacterium]|nr:alpha-glucan family phosphorylase [Acidobacteriota bacterium]
MEISNEAVINMQPAVGLETENNFRDDFYFQRNVPQNLEFLETLSWNYFWSWSKDGTQLFRDLDSRLWEKCEQNPRQMLKKVSELRLWQKANEENYIVRLKEFEEKFNQYVNEPPKNFDKITQENPVAYFCAEYGVHNSLPIYSGGLGILAGDHLKSASDMNVPLVAVGLMYRYGYFRQEIAHDGWQEETYRDSFDEELALKPVLDENGNRINIMIHMRGREVYAQAWLAQVGRISLYLLDTNVSENDEIDRYVTGHLYGGDTETRVVQEKILGIGGIRLL